MLSLYVKSPVYEYEIKWLQGKNIKRELMSLVRDLPKTYDEIADQVKHLDKAVQYYSEFTRFTLKR